MRELKQTIAALLFLFVVTTAASAADVSFTKDIVPLLRKNCQGCHRPAKMKGDLDMTTFKALAKGGKHGPAFKTGDMKSLMLEQVRGDEPKMPPDGDKLSKEEIALLERWVKEGGKDDTQTGPVKIDVAVYKVPPVISAMALSPDGNTLAVSGYHEVLLHKADGSGQIARLQCESPRIESLAYSADGKLLAACGGAPGLYGEVLIWDTASNKLNVSHKIGADSLYGVSFSKDSERVAFGSAEKTVRIISWKDGKELMKFDSHADWVFGTTFTVDDKRILTGSRDRAMKLISADNGQLIDDINKLLEPILCIARNPKEDFVLYGGSLGTARIYKISENQQRTAANNDVNMMKTFERQPGPIRAVAYSPDASLVALGGLYDEIRIYKAADATRVGAFTGTGGPTFNLLFHPDGKQLIASGFDGSVRIIEVPSGKLIKSFVPVPIEGGEKKAAALN